MYLKHYDLESRPFSISPDPKFLWLGEKHAEALAGLEYGILENKGFVLLTGEIGTGKTLLINYLVKSICNEVIVALIHDPRLELIEFYNILAKKFRLNRNFKTKADFLIHFEDFLIKANEQGNKVVLIIDEAQRLKNDLLDEIRVLSNIETETKKLINIFFVGQHELKKKLLEERNRPLKQRITYNYHLIPLDKQETAAFIEHRLRVAGSSKTIFSKGAIGEIHKFSQGVPRLINIICDHSLLTGYSNSLGTIDVDVILECAKELRISDDKPSPSSEKALDVEEVPLAQEQKIIKYLQKSHPSEKPLILNEIIKFLHRLKPTERVSFLKVAGITAIIIISGIVISFFFNSRFEQSDNVLNQNTENFKSENSAGNIKAPLMIAKSKGDAQDTLTGKLYNDKVAIDKNNEEIIPKEQIVNEFEEIEINHQSEDDIDNLTADEVQVITVESKNADENTKEAFSAKVFENKDQTENNNEEIINPLDMANIEIAEFNENTASKTESPEVDMQEKKATEGAKLREIGPKKATVKEIDKKSKSNGNEQFLLSTEQKYYIYYKLNSADLDSQSLKKLNNIAEIVSKNPESDILIEGYADSYGDKYYNKKLSQFRAVIVEGYFVAKGIESSRITAIGLGSDRPIGDNTTKEGRQKNRRVEIKINTKSYEDPLI